VASAKNVSSVLTSRYATALIELTEESGKTDAVDRDLGEMLNMVRDSADLALLVHTPSISRKAQGEAVQTLAEKAQFDALTKNFLGVLVQNRRLNALEAIIAAFRAELAKRRGEITVQVETAQDLSPAQLKSLQDILSKGMSRKVTIRAKVEPSIMGGMIVTVGSHMIDDSVRRKLEKLKAAMGRQANQNVNTNQEAV
jgi:F-type H+-transporting ATPase subunit delta